MNGPWVKPGPFPAPNLSSLLGRRRPQKLSFPLLSSRFLDQKRCCRDQASVPLVLSGDLVETATDSTGGGGAPRGWYFFLEHECVYYVRRLVLLK